MGRLYPAFLALVANSIGLYIYGPSPYKPTEEKLIPSIIFSTGIFALVAYGRAWNNLFHRPAPMPFQFMLQFLGAAYMIELMQATMWLPIQDVFYKQIPAMSDKMEMKCDHGKSIVVCVVYRVLELITLICVADTFPLVLSMIFLACCLHMTDVINLQMFWSPKRLMALLVQYLRKCIGMKNLVGAEADTLNLRRPSVAGGSAGRRGSVEGGIGSKPTHPSPPRGGAEGVGGSKPTHPSPVRVPQPPQGTQQPPSSPKHPLPKLPRCDSPSESPSRRAGASWTRKTKEGD